MKWFEGPIPEAIQSSKQKGVIFIVYIHGESVMISSFDVISFRGVLTG